MERRGDGKRFGNLSLLVIHIVHGKISFIFFRPYHGKTVILNIFS